jgi:hypothetical protein
MTDWWHRWLTQINGSLTQMHHGLSAEIEELSIDTNDLLLARVNGLYTRVNIARSAETKQLFTIRCRYNINRSECPWSSSLLTGLHKVLIEWWMPSGQTSLIGYLLCVIISSDIFERTFCKSCAVVLDTLKMCIWLFGSIRTFFEKYTSSWFELSNFVHHVLGQI